MVLLGPASSLRPRLLSVKLWHPMTLLVIGAGLWLL